jgi:hypothetical protein
MIPKAFRVHAISGLGAAGTELYAGGCPIDEASLDAFGKANDIGIAVQLVAGQPGFKYIGSTTKPAQLVWLYGENVLRAMTSEFYTKPGPIDVIGTKSYCESVASAAPGSQKHMGYGDAIMWTLAVGVVLVTVGYAANAKWARRKL